MIVINFGCRSGLLILRSPHPSQMLLADALFTVHVHVSTNHGLIVTHRGKRSQVRCRIPALYYKIQDLTHMSLLRRLLAPGDEDLCLRFQRVAETANHLDFGKPVVWFSRSMYIQHTTACRFSLILISILRCEERLYTNQLMWTGPLCLKRCKELEEWGIIPPTHCSTCSVHAWVY